MQSDKEKEQDRQENEAEYRDYGDEKERWQKYDHQIGARKFFHSNNILLMLGDLLQPKTTSFKHINADMSCSNVDMFDKIRVVSLSAQIAFYDMYNLKKSLYLAWNDMTTILNLDKSVNGWWGDLFTKTITQKAEEFVDKTPKKTGWLPFGRHKEVQPR